MYWYAMVNNLDHLTPAEILEHLKSILNVQNDNQLANLLGVERQRISQYKSRKGSYMACRMLTLLIEAHLKSVDKNQKVRKAPN